MFIFTFNLLLTNINKPNTKIRNCTKETSHEFLTIGIWIKKGSRIKVQNGLKETPHEF